MACLFCSSLQIRILLSCTTIEKYTMAMPAQRRMTKHSISHAQARCLSFVHSSKSAHKQRPQCQVCESLMSLVPRNHTLCEHAIAQTSVTHIQPHSSAPSGIRCQGVQEIVNGWFTKWIFNLQIWQCFHLCDHKTARVSVPNDPFKLSVTAEACVAKTE